MPYTLEFHSPELTEWAKGLQEKSAVAWDDIVAFMRQSFSAGAEYERLLAMAYLLASLESAAEQPLQRLALEARSAVRSW